MGGALRELIAFFGVEVDNSKLDAFDKRIGDVSENIKKVLVGGALVEAARGFGEFIKTQIELGSHLQDTSELLGIATDDLQRFQQAAKLSGASFEETTTALRFLNRSVGEAADGNAEASQAFAKLKIPLKGVNGEARPLTDMFVDLSDALEKIPDQGKRTETAMKLLGRGGAALLPFLQQGGKRVKELLGDFEKLGGGLSHEFVEAADDAGDQLERLGFSMSALKSTIAFPFLKSIADLAKRFAEFTGSMVKTIKQSEIVKAFFLTLGGILGGYMVVKAFALVKSLGGVLNALTLLTKVAGIAAIVAAFTALVLIVDDLMVAFEGGNSVIKEALENLYGYEGAKKILGDLKGAYQKVADAFTNSLPDIKSLGKELITAFVDAIPGLINFSTLVIKTFSALFTLLGGAGRAVSALFDGDFSKVGKVIDEAGNKVFGKGGIFEGGLGYTPQSSKTSDYAKDVPLLNGVGSGLEFGPPKANPYAPDPNMHTIAMGSTPSLPGYGIRPDITQTNNIDITVQGGGDAVQTARKVATSVGDVQLQQRQALAAITGGL